MAQRFWSLYEALNEDRELEREAFDALIHHIRTEFAQKHSRYTGRNIYEYPQLLEELVQSVCSAIAIGVKEHKFDPSFNTFKNWIDGLIVKTLIKHYEREKRQKMQGIISLEGLIEDGADWNSGEENDSEWLLITAESKEERTTAVKKALQILHKRNVKYYQVFYSRCFQCLSTADTAALLNISTEDVYRTLNRAKTELAKIIESIYPQRIR